MEDLSEFVEPRRAFPDEDIRWAADENWHITLAFLGDVPEYKTDELGERLEAAAKRQTPFHLQLRGAGRFRVWRMRGCCTPAYGTRPMR